MHVETETPMHKQHTPHTCRRGFACHPATLKQTQEAETEAGVNSPHAVPTQSNEKKQNKEDTYKRGIAANTHNTHNIRYSHVQQKFTYRGGVCSPHAVLILPAEAPVCLPPYRPFCVITKA